MAVDLTTVPLTALTNESRSILSSLLNPRKVLPIIGPDGLPRHRDWRGLASLAQISTEVAASINDYADKTARVLDIWSQRIDGLATVGTLLSFLQLLDRFDACEDLVELHRQDKLIVRGGGQQIVSWDGDDRDLITYDDKLLGFPQKYHAYVLYAREDKEFVDEVVSRMKTQGLKMCTEEDLLVGHATKVAPVSRLILERCRYIVLIYSPDFLRSPAITFYTNLAQADAINKQQIKLIPIMYRECSLPELLAQYHRLYYKTRGEINSYFWYRLSDSLRIVNTPRIEYNMSNSTYSSMSINELSNSKSVKMNGFKEDLQQLALPSVPTDTSSMNDLHKLHKDPASTEETKSLSNTSQTDKKKKKTIGARIINTLKGKKTQKNCH
ncbi:unnamed protein product, partial [Brenthis ino]